jgi:phosphoglycolate phosphatase-like HAD superfamily hydrolase
MTLSSNWYPRNRRALEKFLSLSFINDYAVVDFDNTLSIGDSQWTLFSGQAERMAYELKPEELHNLLSKEFTEEEFVSKIPSFSFSYGDVIEDIVNSYRVFYAAGETGFKTQIRPTTHHLEKEEFLTKMLFLLSQVESFLSVDAACRFIQYPFVHLSPKEVYSLAMAVHSEIADQTQKKGIEHVLHTPPKEIQSRTGVISVELDEGFMVVPEMSELLQEFAQKGIALYCISSSQEDTIKAAIENPPFHLPPFKGIFTENLLLDKTGHYCGEYDFIRHPSTFGEGKKQAIIEKLLPLYHGKSPVFMAGDSDGDYAFLSSFEEAKIILIFNRGQRCVGLQKLKAKALEEEKIKAVPHYLVQGRNTPKAQLWPKEECLDSRFKLHLGNGDFVK